MTFLAPTALLGILLLAIPIIVHLFKPRKMRRTPFSSLRWLRQAHQRLSRRIQWHQWLLFLLRAGVIVLLVLALARPLIGFREEGRPTDRFVILDVGRTMAYEGRGIPAPLERARVVAANVLEHTRPGDRTALLLAGSKTQLVSPLVADTAGPLAAVRDARVESADNTASSALPVVRSLLGTGKSDRDVELVFLTANRQRSWQQSEVQAFLQNAPAPARVQVVDVGPGAPQNGWIASARLLDSGEADYRVLRVEVGCVGDARQERSVRLTGIAALGDDVQQITLDPGRTGRVDFKIPSAVSLSGQVAELRLEPGDSLPDDDRFFLSLDAPWSLRVLLVEPEPAGPGARPAGLYLRAGVEALASSSNQALALLTRTPAAITAGDFRKADVIFLAGVRELSDGALESLEERVRAGAGLVVFLGPDVTPAFYNQKLFKALQPAEGLLPAPLKTSPDTVKQGNPGVLTKVRWSHPLLAPLHDPLLGDLTLSRFSSYASFAEMPGKGDTILAWLDDETPALVERSLGAGRVLVWNTTADDRWSDLPRRRSFVPLLDRMLSYLSAGGIQRRFAVGRAMTLPLTDWQAGDEVAVVTPGGDRRTPRLQGLGGQMFLHLDAISEAGVYRVERPGKTGAGFPFAVNVPRDGSPLAPMDSKTLEQWWAPIALEVLGAEDASQRWAARSESWPLWPALILVACLLLLAETVYVYRLCPRLNPSVAESVVPQRGLLRPLSQTQQSERPT